MIPLNLKFVFYIQLISFLITFSGQAQNTFFKIYDSPYNDYSYDAVATSTGDFILIGERATSYLKDTSSQYVLKIDKAGNFIKDTVLEVPLESSRADFILKMPNSDDNFIIGGWTNLWKNDTFYNEMVYSTIDSDLDLQSQAIFVSKPNEVHRVSRPAMVDDSLLYVLSTYSTFNTSSRIAVSKFNLEFDSIGTYYSPPVSALVGDIIYIDKDSILKIIYLGSGISKSNPTKILNLDRELNFLNCVEGPPAVLTDLCGTVLNDSSYLLTGNGHPSYVQALQHILMYKMSNNDDSLDLLEYYNSPDTILYAGGCTNTVVTDDAVYIVGMYNFIPEQYPWQTSPIWLQLTKTDLNLNVISDHFYGGDAVYTSFSILETLDGGILISGDRWDCHNTNDLRKSVFALKTDADGVYVNATSDLLHSSNGAVICPNPGTDYFVVLKGGQYPEATVTLYDITGKVMIHERVAERQTRIDATTLPAGCYPYHIISNGTIVGAGKWIKK